MKAFAYRINRPTYGVLLLGYVMLYALLVMTMARPPGAELGAIVLLVPRLHDIGRSGWWAGVLVVAEIAIIGIGMAAGDAAGIEIAGGIFVMVALIALIVIACIPGQSRRNRWGDPPPPGISFKRPERNDSPRVRRRF